MAVSKAKFSDRGLPFESAVDGAALSVTARERTRSIPLYYSTAAGSANAAYFVQNATKKHTLGPVGFPGTLTRAYISTTTAPAGGTLTWKIVAYDASANAEIVLTDSSATNPESITGREAQAQTLATTNVALDSDDTLELHCIADNNAVSQDAVGLCVTLVFDPLVTSETTTR